jgi:hypothetical protein
MPVVDQAGAISPVRGFYPAVHGSLASTSSYAGFPGPGVHGHVPKASAVTEIAGDIKSVHAGQE